LNHVVVGSRKEKSMSLRSPLAYVIPDETARVARAAFPKGTLVMQVYDALGPLFTNAQFAALFSPTGQPAEDPARLALVLVLQFLEGLSDRQAAEAVRDRIAWKYALGLELTDPGFDASVLSEFRDRLIAGQAEQLLLDSMLERLQERGLLKARGRQRTDSTHVLAAIRTLNRLTCVGETMRQALNALAAEEPDWLRQHVPTDWFDRYGRRLEDARLPRAKTARAALGATIGADGFWLLTLLEHPDTPVALRSLPEVHILRRIWWQQYYAPQSDTSVRWRDDDDTPPPGQLIHSPYDIEARYSTKRDLSWVGYKTHLSETCDDDAPNVITHVLTTEGTAPDDTMTAAIHAALAAKQLLPASIWSMPAIPVRSCSSTAGTAIRLNWWGRSRPTQAGKLAPKARTRWRPSRLTGTLKSSPAPRVRRVATGGRKPAPTVGKKSRCASRSATVALARGDPSAPKRRTRRAA